MKIRIVLVLMLMLVISSANVCANDSLWTQTDETSTAYLYIDGDSIRKTQYKGRDIIKAEAKVQYIVPYNGKVSSEISLLWIDLDKNAFKQFRLDQYDTKGNLLHTIYSDNDSYWTKLPYYFWDKTIDKIKEMSKKAN